MQGQRLLHLMVNPEPILLFHLNNIQHLCKHFNTLDLHFDKYFNHPTNHGPK